MKKTQLKDSVRNIFRRKIAFLSLFATLTVGIAGLLCIFTVANSLDSAAADLYRETNFMDIELISSLGLGEESIEKLKASPIIKDAEGAFSVSAILSAGDKRENTNVISLTERISVPKLTSGRLPQGLSECVLDKNYLEALGLKVGDKLRLYSDNAALGNILLSEEFTVTGTVLHPNSINRSRSMDVIVSPEAFNEQLFGGGTLCAYVRLDLSDDLSPFSSEYQQQADELIDKLEPIIRETEQQRTAEVKELLSAFTSLDENAELKEIIDPGNIPECSIFVRSRKMNVDCEEIRTTTDSIRKTAWFFSPLFAVVGAIVCFSTIAIIIDDQKQQVGTVKALGFSSSTIRKKYLIFGLTSSVGGALTGTLLSFFLSRFLGGIVADRYVFDGLPVVPSPLSMILICALTVISVYIVVRAACAGLLKCSAMGLINGSEPVRKSISSSKNGKRNGSLYSSLIINNIRTDMKRVVVAVSVIAASGLLIGLGITMHHSFTSTFTEQDEKICTYELKIAFRGGISEQASAALEKDIADSGAEYDYGYYGGTVFSAGGDGAASRLLIMDKDKVSRYFDIGEVYDRGVTVSRNTSDSYGLPAGSRLLLASTSLQMEEANIRGVFDYYIGSLICISRESYQLLYGREAPVNCCFVNGTPEELERLTQLISDPDAPYYNEITAETRSDLLKSSKASKRLFDAVAIVLVVLAAVLNFMIMTNLTNILVSRRMKELLIMRVNGFSMKQVTGYLTRETLATTCLGILLSLAAGIPFGKFFCTAVGNANTTLKTDISVTAWVVSAVLNALFALIVNSVSFRKVKKAQLTNITQA